MKFSIKDFFIYCKVYDLQRRRIATRFSGAFSVFFRQYFRLFDVIGLQPVFCQYFDKSVSSSQAVAF